MSAPVATYRFPEGFTFSYSVDWRLVTGGTATLRLDNVNGEHHIVANADSTGAVALLYHVQDHLETFYNPQTNCALALVKHTEEGFRRVDTKIRYDYSHKKAVVDEQNLRAKNQKHEENDIGTCVSNTLAAPYYVASQPLQPGAKFTFPSSDGGKTADIATELTPAANEPVVSSGVDKFMNTDLEKILKEKGVTTVIVVGTAAHGAVLYTASGAAMRGMKVIVPVDGVSAEATYMEQYVAWHLVNVPVISPAMTLTTIDNVKF